MGKLHIICLISLTFTLASIVFFGCNKNEDSSTQKISKHSSSESHYSGQNCMNCHYRAGEGEGWFTMAGTVVENSLNSTIVVSTEPKGGGTVIDRVEVDRLGNFYTTDPISYSNGLYVSVQSANGELEEMDGKIYNGGCNYCHGEGKEDPIEAE